ncbi:MAG: hypothetical protein RRB13_02060 [bacterium]|nr:hypothetical protein [bacterium]
MTEPAAQATTQPPGNKALDQSLARGFMLLRGRLMKAALNELQKALKIDPKAAKTSMNQQFGRVYQQKSFEEALNLGKLLLKIEPRNYVILNHMGSCARQLKLRDEAEQYYRRALQFKPDYLKAIYNLGANRAKVDWYDNAVEENIRKQLPRVSWWLPPFQNTSDLMSEVRIELAEQGETESFTSVFNVLTARVKTNWKNHPPDKVQQVIQGDNFNLALYVFLEGEYPRAEEIFCHLAKQASTLPEVASFCLISRIMQDPSPENIEAAAKLAAETPHNRALLQNLGVAFLKQNHPIEGYRYLCQAACLLERSEGLYSAVEIAQRASEYLENEHFDIALSLYEEVCLIAERTEIRAKMAEVYRAQGDHDKAMLSYEKMREGGQEDDLTKTVIQEAHDAYLKLAEQALEDKKFKLAQDFNARALQLRQEIDTLRQKVRILSVLNQHEEVEKLEEEIQRLKVKRDQEAAEIKRQNLIREAKVFYKSKDFLKAARILEDALNMKKDRDVFLLLAGIYKGIKHTRSLNNLLYKWKTMPEPKVEEVTEEVVEEEVATPKKELDQVEEITSRPQFDFDLDL